MSFRRKDFHNSRAYEADPPTRDRRRLTIGISSAVAWVKVQFDKLLQSGASSPIATLSLSRENNEPFSLLGSDRPDLPSQTSESTVFPMADREPGFQTRLRPAGANDRQHERKVER